jgi:hypothetical protein
MTRRNELFFATRSLARDASGCVPPLDDPEILRFPALLNISRYRRIDMKKEGKSLAWICTMNWKERAAINREPDPGIRMVKAVNGLLKYLFSSRYNYSSEEHPLAHNSMELRSWFTETVMRGVDERISTIQRWERETRRDPFFVLSVDWIKTGYSCRGVAERIFDMYDCPDTVLNDSADLARVVFNQMPQGGASHGYPHTLF